MRHQSSTRQPLMAYNIHVQYPSTTNLMSLNELANSINKHQLAVCCADKQIQHSITVDIVLSHNDTYN